MIFDDASETALVASYCECIQKLLFPPLETSHDVGRRSIGRYVPGLPVPLCDAL